MNGLLSLKNTLLKLKKKEINSLITFLNSYKRNDEQNLKSVRLVNLLLKDKTYSSNQVQEILYGKTNYHAFNKLVNRLKDKIREIIIFDSNLIQSDHYGKRNTIVFEIKKKLLQGEVMFARGINEDINYFLNKIILKAKQFEIYDSIIEALQAKQRYIGVRFGSTINSQIKKEIDFFEKNRRAYNRAIEIYNSITSKISFSISYLEYKDELERAIKILRRDFEETKSASIGYYFLFLLTEHYQNKNDFVNAQKTLIGLKELLKNNISIHTKYRFGVAILNIANNELLMFNFKDCVIHINEVLSYFAYNSVNIGIAKEVEFYGLFYLGKMDKAEKLIEELYHSSRTSKTPFIYSKRACLFAWIKTLQGEFVQSNELLTEVKEIEKDKEGWNIGVRILTIINFIELGYFEKAERETGRLKRHIVKTMVTKTVRKRFVVIQDVFLQLMKHGYDFKKVFKGNQRYFNLLESTDIDYRWEIRSPEMLIFQEWFKSKMDNRAYDVVSALQTEKERRTRKLN